jgi:hypothetical protein
MNSLALGITGTCVHAILESVVGCLIRRETFAALEAVDFICDTATFNVFLVLGGTFAQRVLLLGPRIFLLQAVCPLLLASCPLLLAGCVLLLAGCVLLLACSQLGGTIYFIIRERVDFWFVFWEGILSHLHPKDIGTSHVVLVAA